MTTGMVSVDNCPRDLDGILSIQRGIRYRLGIQTHMFKNEAEEQAFLGSTDQVQAESLLSHLQQFDAGTIQQVQQVQPPTQIALPPAPPQQPVAPGVTSTTAMQMPAQMQMPMQMPVGPQMPAVVPPPAAPQQQVLSAPPQRPQVSMPSMPAMPGQVQQQAPQMPPQMPQQLQAPQAQAAPSGKRPSTLSDPTNAGAKVPVDPRAAQFNQQLAQVLKDVRDTISAQGELIESLEGQLAGMTRILTTVLAVQLAVSEQGGLDRTLLAKCIKAMGEEAPEDFLGLFEEGEDAAE